ncbi:uncharacterized protein LOC124594045 [Schistocerca americana]|uniref:uncharacterized protein LOC124594045 n=1 Tax=Schistocerca americana TaxID=7009 RepID=UPI001F4F53D5|nr:uncharacterized protein LOC124594045 [Schistocerca americana]
MSESKVRHTMKVDEQATGEEEVDEETRALVRQEFGLYSQLMSLGGIWPAGAAEPAWRAAARWLLLANSLLTTASLAREAALARHRGVTDFACRCAFVVSLGSNNVIMLLMLLLDISYPVDGLVGGRARQLLLLLDQAAVAFNHMCSVAAFNSMFVHFVVIACQHLQRSIDDLTADTCDIVAVVRHHQQILRYIKELEDVYYIIMLWVFLPMMAVMCLIMFALLTITSVDIEFLEMLAFFLIYFITNGVISICGSMLTSKLLQESFSYLMVMLSLVNEKDNETQPAAILEPASNHSAYY